VSPSFTPVYVTAWYEVGRTSEIYNPAEENNQHSAHIEDKIRQTFLIRNRVGESQQVVVGQRNSYIFGLASSITTNEVRIAEDAAQAPTIELILKIRGIGLFASRGKLLLAELALTAGDTEAVHNPLTRLQLLNSWAYGFDHTAELVAKYIALLKLEDDAVQEMNVAATYGCAGNLDDGVMVIDDFGLACLNCDLTLILPSTGRQQSGMKYSIPTRTSFLPIHTNAFIFSPPLSAYMPPPRSGLEISVCAARSRSPWPRTFSAFLAAKF
jgi:hypothetical protein